MKTRRVVLVVMGGVLLALAQWVWGDEGRHDGWSGLARGVAADLRPVDHALYKAECSSCHQAYQPGLLPASAWQRIMGSLDQHFGENAELAAADVANILDYLQANAADVAKFGRSAAFARRTDSESVRITESPYFRRKHSELPARVVQDPRIGSFSNCIACHRTAEQGVYDEHTINIPGLGRWDD